jgi:hypothetical protein
MYTLRDLKEMFDKMDDELLDLPLFLLHDEYCSCGENYEEKCYFLEHLNFKIVEESIAFDDGSGKKKIEHFSVPAYAYISSGKDAAREMKILVRKVLKSIMKNAGVESVD